jgi:hypothetical protein
VFGRGELGEREVEGREIEEKLAISLVWQTKEIGERELKHVGPTCFYFSSHERRKAEKGGFFFKFPYLPLSSSCFKLCRNFKDWWLHPLVFSDLITRFYLI